MPRKLRKRKTETVSPSEEIPSKKEKCPSKISDAIGGSLFVWPLAFNNFSKFQCEAQQYTSFPIKVANYEFKIKVYPNGYNKETRGYVSIFLKLIKPCKANVDFSFSLLFDTEKWLCTRLTHCFDADSGRNLLGWRHFADRSIVMDQLSALKNDQLVILLEIFDLDVPGCSYKLQRLSRYEKLLNNVEFSDVEIVIEGETIHAHRTILSNENDAFAAMLEGKGMGGEKIVITIEDVEFEVMLELIRFIYVGQVRNMEKIPKELLIAADKYGISELKSQCGTFMSQILSTENVIDYLNFADLYRVDELRKEAITFFMKYRKDIAQIPDFRSKLKTLGSDLTTDLMTDHKCLGPPKCTHAANSPVKPRKLWLAYHLIESEYFHNKSLESHRYMYLGRLHLHVISVILSCQESHQECFMETCFDHYYQLFSVIFQRQFIIHILNFSVEVV